MTTLDRSSTTTSPSPSSSLSWSAELSTAAQDDHLPLPCLLDVLAHASMTARGCAWISWRRLIPSGLVKMNQPSITLGWFIFTGDPAAFFDELSSYADAVWLKKQLQGAERPFTHCPVCMLNCEKRPSCANCKGRGWIDLPPEEGRRLVEDALAKRKALVAAAWAK